MLAAAALIEEVGARIVGVAVIVDQSPPSLAGRLPRFHSIIPADVLGSPAF
jgi:hypothetical protein